MMVELEGKWITWGGGGILAVNEDHVNIRYRSSQVIQVAVVMHLQ